MGPDGAQQNHSILAADKYTFNQVSFEIFVSTERLTVGRASARPQATYAAAVRLGSSRNGEPAQ